MKSCVTAPWRYRPADSARSSRLRCWLSGPALLWGGAHSGWHHRQHNPELKEPQKPLPFEPSKDQLINGFCELSNHMNFELLHEDGRHFNPIFSGIFLQKFKVFFLFGKESSWLPTQQLIFNILSHMTLNVMNATADKILQHTDLNVVEITQTK